MRPLSPMDQTFLWLERRNQPMHVGGLQLITPPPDAPPPDFVQRIAERIRNPAEAVPPFNHRSVQRSGMWFWTEDEDFDITLNSYADKMEFGITACRRALPHIQRCWTISSKALGSWKARPD